ncbi:hypothetical protein [Psychrobacillus glaciei]|uniref:hypothetical protein n=1 Tax=Psychrobacillus glaciei TaxID=2283160 RepID=UPI001CEF6A7B|nr:hypothetical protein [Psychrobacillus glaciei]
MKRWFTPFFIFFILLLTGCSEEEDKNVLTRVDVYKVNAVEQYEEEVIISDKSGVDVLSKAFEQIVWEQNVKAEMVRKADIKVVLFMEVEENMPELLDGYFIWFNQNGTATIINRDANSLGKLDEKNVQMLKSILNLD